MPEPPPALVTDPDARHPGVTRVVVEWSRPLVDRVAEHLQALRPSGDLEDVLVVLPARRTGRLLLRRLVAGAPGDARRVIAPPRLAAPVELARCLFAVPEEIVEATPAAVTAAWASALEERGESVGLVANDDGARARARERRLADATRLRSTWATVARAGLTSDDVAQVVLERFGRRHDAERWHALGVLAADVRERLGARGSADPVVVDRRRIADARVRDDAPSHLVVAGVVDLDSSFDEIAARAPCPIDVLVAFDPDRAIDEWFDPFGRLHPTVWLDRAANPTPIATSSIEVVRSADRAVRRAIEHLADEDDVVDPARVVLVSTNADALAPLVRAASARGVPLHAAAGRDAAESAPGRLLVALRAFSDARNDESFTALVRLPSFVRAIDRVDQRVGNDPLPMLESHLARSAGRFDAPAWRADPDEAHRDREADRRAEAIDALRTARSRLEDGVLAPGLRANERADRLGAFLDLAFGNTHDDALLHDDATIAACDVLAAWLAGWSDLQDAPVVSAGDLLADGIDALRRHPVRTPVRAGEVDCLGWLDARSDDAPRTVVFGLTEGGDLGGGGIDPWLPESLRTALGVPGDAMRRARDVYAFASIAARSDVVAIVPRRSPDGDPLVPSSLLLADEGVALAERVRVLFSDETDGDGVATGGARASVPDTPGASASRGDFACPKPPSPAPRVRSLSVTDFREWLAAPWLFWIRRVERLDAPRTLAREIPISDLGSWTHRTLEMLGEIDDATHADGAGLGDALVARWCAELEERLGGHVPTAVRVQSASIEERLRSFALIEAASFTEGWRVVHVEMRLEGATLSGLQDDEPMPISGIVDRVDVHPVSGRWRILDYKTGNAHRSLRKRARDADGEWRDLQLPLYRHLLADRLRDEHEARGFDAPFALDAGYVHLPAKTAEVSIECAIDVAGSRRRTPWTEDDFDSGVRRARGVIDEIRAASWPELSQVERAGLRAGDDLARLARSAAFEHGGSEAGEDDA